MNDPETQAARITRICGVERLARWTSRTVTQVYRWDYPKAKGGSGGLIPAFHHQAILDGARDEGVKLRASDFYPVKRKAA